MAITRLTAPSDPAAADTDWTELLALKDAIFLAANGPILRVSGGNIVKGAVFQIGGTVYLADADTAIAGTASDYVQITPAGASASAAYVANLSGVTWNQTYNGWYDGSGNLYIFDEGTALLAGEISTLSAGYVQKNEDGQVGGDLIIENDLDVGNDLSVGGALGVTGAATLSGGITETTFNLRRKVFEIGTWNMDSTTTVQVSIGAFDYSKVVGVQVLILSDPGEYAGSLSAVLDLTISGSWGLYGENTYIQLLRTLSGDFDSTSFNSTSINRGYVIITFTD